MQMLKCWENSLRYGLDSTRQNRALLKWTFAEIRYEDAGCIQLAQDKMQWHAFMNSAMNITENGISWLAEQL
jgi:hypothetical protein